MTLKNKKLISLKYFEWVNINYNDSTSPTFFFPKIDWEFFCNIHRGLELTMSEKEFYQYWFANGDISLMFFNIASLKQTLFEEHLLNKTVFEWNQENVDVFKDFFNSFFGISIQLWFSLPPFLQDLNALYKNHNKKPQDLYFILFDFWFHNLFVIDELVRIFEELQLKIVFNKNPFDSDIFGFSINAIALIEPYEANLKSLHCENWSKNDFINSIVSQFDKIDMTIFYEWLMSKKIENIYESKEKLVLNYLVDSATGLGSLSISTLKLLALNPILDFVSLRQICDEERRVTQQGIDRIKQLSPEEQHAAAVEGLVKLFIGLGSLKKKE